MTNAAQTSFIQTAAEPCHTASTFCWSRFAYIEDQRLVLDRLAGALMTADMLLARWGHCLPDQRRLTLCDVPIVRYRSLAVAPDQSEAILRDGALYLNASCPGDLVPHRGQSWTFYALAYHVAGGPLAYEALLDYLAFLAQHPGRKLGYALTLVGDSGIGKSVFARMVAELFSSRATTVHGASALAAAYNEWMCRPQLVIVDRLAAMSPYAAERLRGLIAEPEIEINARSGERFRVHNGLNFLGLARCVEDVLLDGYGTINVPITSDSLPLPPNLVWEWLEDFEGSRHCALDALLRRNLDHFNPDVPPPELLLYSGLSGRHRARLAHRLRKSIAESCWPFEHDLVDQAELVAALREQSSEAVSPADVVQVLARLGALYMGQCDVYGQWRCLWAVRNLDFWERANPSAVEDSFVSILGTGPERNPGVVVGKKLRPAPVRK